MDMIIYAHKAMLITHFLFFLSTATHHYELKPTTTNGNNLYHLEMRDDYTHTDTDDIDI